MECYFLAEPAVYVLASIEETTCQTKFGFSYPCLGVAPYPQWSESGCGLYSFGTIFARLTPLSIAMTYVVAGLVVRYCLSIPGGVSSGTITQSFILAFTQGVAEATEGANVLVDGFGVIAMVAIPLIAAEYRVVF